MKRATMASAERRKETARRELERLYEADETAWLEHMVELIGQGRRDELDYKNLSEFLLSMARRDRREVQSRLVVLLKHLLKWTHQPRKRARSWLVTIVHRRHELQDDVESKTLRNHAEAVLARAYARAVVEAAAETGLSESRFPAACPYTLEQLLTEGAEENE